MCSSSGMGYSPPRRASYPSPSLNLVCKILRWLYGMSETNTIGYYRTALKTLGEPFFERRVLVDIDAEPPWEKKGRKTTRFQDSAELRHALEEALRRHGVR